MLKRPTFYLAILGMVAAIFLVLWLRKVEPPAGPLSEPSSAPFAESIGARGIIESVDENVRIAPAIAGLVARVLVKVGDFVEQGAPLIELDRRDAEAQVAAQEAQLVRLHALIKEAEVNLADRRDQSRRMEKLAATRVASEDERQRSSFALQVATTRLETAGAELASAQAQLHRNKVQLALLTIDAPRAGTILQVNIRAGEYASIANAEPLLLLGQVRRLQLRADVDEDNASRVRPGCKALAFIKGQRADAIPLQFERIEPYIVPKRSLTGESSERVDTRVLQIIFRFEPPQLPVYVGQQMDVFLDAGAPAGRHQEVRPASWDLWGEGE